MPEQHLYEYAVLRLVPRVEREEFLNVGVVLYCAKQGFLKTRFVLDAQRLKALCTDLDFDELHEYLCTWERICLGDKTAGAIAQLPMAGRFRWLTAARSTVIQSSKVHPGMCHGPAQHTLDNLFEQLVL